MTSVDTNVLLDVATDGAVWADWSQRHLDAAAARGPVLINDAVYAEPSAGFTRTEELDEALREVGVAVERTPHAGLFLAAKAHLRHRARGVTRTGVLPDLFIGVHPAVAFLPPPTRDAARHRTLFPTAQLICP